MIENLLISPESFDYGPHIFFLLFCPRSQDITGSSTEKCKKERKQRKKKKGPELYDSGDINSISVIKIVEVGFKGD